jgi:uncharacterized protein (TIGR03067 family)
MTRRITPLVLAVAFAAAPLAAAQTPQGAAAKPPAQGAPQGAKPAGVLAALQGVWKMTTTNGQDMAAAGQDITITITGSNYVQTVNGAVVEKGSFKIDESKKPMTMDLQITEGDSAGQAQFGVFELKGNTLSGKMAEPGSTTRPTDFAVAEGFFTFVMVKK